MGLEDEHKQIQEAFDKYNFHYAKLKGLHGQTATKSSATQARKALQEIAVLCKVIRKSVSDHKEKM